MSLMQQTIQNQLTKIKGAGDKQSEVSEDETQIMDKIKREFEEFLERKYEMSP